MMSLLPDCSTELPSRGAPTYEEVIRHRLKVYEEETAPLIAKYRERGIVKEVDGLGEIADVTERILKSPILGLYIIKLRLRHRAGAQLHERMPQRY